MKKRKQNKRKLHQVFRINKNNPIEARKLYENYLQENPSHYSVYVYYSSVLIMLQEFELAEKMLDYAEEIYNSSYENRGNVNLSKKFDDLVFENRIKLLSYQNRYEELYEFCLENYDRKKDMRVFLNKIIFYCETKLGLLENEDRKNHFYIYRQMIDYSESDFFCHIKKHLFSFNENVDNPNDCIFAKDFPLRKIVKEVKKYIPSSKRLCDDFYVDTYVFKYNLCGKCNDKIEDYFKVTCFHDTNEIITMCPAMYYEESPFVDLNYLRDEIEKPKVKTLSQIEKFNQRYRKNI